ncbi:MAG: hypothetical protein WC982_13125 [Advenella sp.]
MRRSKRIKIDDREIEVLELRVKDLRALPELVSGGLDGGLKGFEEAAGRILPLCTTLTLQDADDMAPSELRAVWGAFREVNADFFEMQAKARAAAGRVGILDDLMTAVRESVRAELSRSTSAFVCSSSEGTPMPPSTDTDSSFGPSG